MKSIFSDNLTNDNNNNRKSTSNRSNNSNFTNEININNNTNNNSNTKSSNLTTFIEKICDEANVIIWALGYSSNLLPIYNHEGNKIRIHYKTKNIHGNSQVFCIKIINYIYYNIFNINKLYYKIYIISS